MKGSVYFDWENRNDVYLATDDTQSDRAGFTRVIVGETTHPYSDHLWALAGLGIGYAEPIALQFYEFIRGILNKSQVSPNLHDGLMNNRVIDAVVTSLDTQRFVKV
jgi:hypothetical protein